MSRLLHFALLLIAFAGSASAQTTYTGNGNTGFGGVVGPGSLVLSDDGTTLTGVFTRGAGALNDALVLYLDTRPGGIASTSVLADNMDLGRRAVSGFDGTNRSTVTFPTGLEPDFGISIQNGFVGLFELVPGAALTYVTTGNLVVSGSTYTFDFSFAELGRMGSTINFVGSYLNASNVFRSDEAFGPGVPPGNPGYTTIGFSGSLSYALPPLPVTLTRLSAKPSTRGVQLDWTTASETKNAGFSVERSIDGKRWESLGFVSGFGESRQLRDYSFLDQAAAKGVNYYRLVQRDLDGEEALSDIVSAQVADLVGGLRVLSAQPAHASAELLNASEVDLDVEFFSPSGQGLQTLRISAGASNTLDLGALPAGVYHLRAGGLTQTLLVQ